MSLLPILPFVQFELLTDAALSKSKIQTHTEHTVTVSTPQQYLILSSSDKQSMAVTRTLSHRRNNARIQMF